MFYKLVAVSSLLMALGGCASMQNGQSSLTGQSMDASDHVKAVKDAMDAAMKSASTQAGNPQTVQTDPTLVTFDKMSVKLTPAAEAQLLALSPGLSIATSIKITGYCYRRDIGNAPSAARARALAVKLFLIKGGIPGSKISVRVDTEHKLHAVRVAFSG